MISNLEEARQMIEEGFSLAGYYPGYIRNTKQENSWIIPVNHRLSIRADLVYTKNKYYDLRIYRQLLDLSKTGMSPEISEKIYEVLLTCYHHRSVKCSLYNNSLWVTAFITLEYENSITLKNLLIDFIKAYGFYDKQMAGLLNDPDYNRYNS